MIRTDSLPVIDLDIPVSGVDNLLPIVDRQRRESIAVAKLAAPIGAHGEATAGQRVDLRVLCWGAAGALDRVGTLGGGGAGVRVDAEGVGALIAAVRGGGGTGTREGHNGPLGGGVGHHVFGVGWGGSREGRTGEEGHGESESRGGELHIAGGKKIV